MRSTGPPRSGRKGSTIVRVSEIHYPQTVQELTSLLEANPEILLLAGGTEIVGLQSARVISFPDEVASIARLPELRKTIRTERFVETGACTTLTGLLSLSPGSLPIPVPEVIGSIGNLGVRNLATIGGNLCSKRGFMDLWPLLACMDAQVELRSGALARWASLSHLCGPDGLPYLPRATLLSRVRIPLYAYNFVFVRRFGATPLSADRACFVCLANVSGEKVEDFRLALAGQKAFRLKDLELQVSGKRLGRGMKDLEGFVADYVEAFGDPEWFSADVFAALVEESFERLCA